MDKKMTRVEALTLAINTLTDYPAAVEVLTSIRDTIIKANSRKTDKPTKTQVENAGIKAQLLAHLTREGVRCGDLATAVGISGQKCSALLSQLVKNGQARKVEGAKRVTLFALPDEG